MARVLKMTMLLLCTLLLCAMFPARVHGYGAADSVLNREILCRPLNADIRSSCSNELRPNRVIAIIRNDDGPRPESFAQIALDVFLQNAAAGTRSSLQQSGVSHSCVQNANWNQGNTHRLICNDRQPNGHIVEAAIAPNSANAKDTGRRDYYGARIEVTPFDDRRWGGWRSDIAGGGRRSGRCRSSTVVNFRNARHQRKSKKKRRHADCNGEQDHQRPLPGFHMSANTMPSPEGVVNNG